MKSEITLISEGMKGEIYVEPGQFESARTPRRLPRRLYTSLANLPKNWIHKSELYPQGQPELAVKYLWALGRVIPGIYEHDGAGNYRLSPFVEVFKSIRLP